MHRKGMLPDNCEIKKIKIKVDFLPFAVFHLPSPTSVVLEIKLKF